jgi:thymidine phosphorylase
MESNINQNEINDYIINYINNKMEEYQNNILVLPSLNHSNTTTEVVPLSNHFKKSLDRIKWDKYLNVNRKKSKRFTIEI